MVVAVAAVGIGGEQVAAAVKVVVADEGGEGAAAGVRTALADPEQQGATICGQGNGCMGYRGAELGKDDIL